MSEVALALEISERQIFRLRKVWNIGKQKGSDKYFYTDNTKLLPQDWLINK